MKDGLGPRPVAQSAKHYFLSLVYSCFCILASNFLFRASFACYVRWDCLSFLASFFGLLTLHLASLSVPPSLAPHLHCTTLVACNLFSDALPLLSAGVGGFCSCRMMMLRIMILRRGKIMILKMRILRMMKWKIILRKMRRRIIRGGRWYNVDEYKKGK